jgi:hypothetical protein
MAPAVKVQRTMEERRRQQRPSISGPFDAAAVGAKNVDKTGISYTRRL